MKLFSSIVATAVIGSSFLIPNPAVASNMFNVTKRLQHSRNDGDASIIIIDEYGGRKVVHTGDYKDAYPMDGQVDPKRWYTRSIGRELNNALKDLMND